MKIWLSDPDSFRHGPWFSVGAYRATLDNTADAAVMVHAETQRDDLTGGAAAWIVPAGLGNHIDLLETLVGTGDPMYVAVNGLGGRSLQTVRMTVPTSQLAWMFDARDQERIAYFEQLAWLASRDVPFVVMARSTEKLLEAIIAGARDLIIPDVADVDFSSLSRVAASMDASANRPVSGTEVDHLHGIEVCLSVRRPIAVGEVLEAADLTIVQAAEKGISPHVRDKVVGKVARYDIDVGEPLHFGYLKDQ